MVDFNFNLAGAVFGYISSGAIFFLTFFFKRLIKNYDVRFTELQKELMNYKIKLDEVELKVIHLSNKVENFEDKFDMILNNIQNVQDEITSQTQSFEKRDEAQKLRIEALNENLHKFDVNVSNLHTRLNYIENSKSQEKSYK